LSNCLIVSPSDCPIIFISIATFMDRQRFLISALALLTVFRLALLPTMELSPDEALAVISGQHWQWWYLEMGPLVPWLVKLSTAVIGHTEFAVRCWAPLLMFGASLCVFRLTRGIIDEQIASWSLLFTQVLPSFNIAATTMTSGSVGLAFLCGYVMALRIALHRANRVHPSWLGAGLCLFFAMLADWRNGLAYFCTIAALLLHPRRQHHLAEPGFLIISAGFSVPSLMFMGWNWAHGWPSWEAGECEALWQILPNLLRWTLMASPMLLTLLLWAIGRAIRRWSVMSEHVLLFSFLLPFALLDLGWGPQERWPHVGWPFWMVLSCCILAYQMVGRIVLPMPSKIALRTVTVILAGAQSMVLMRSDLLRAMYVSWPFQNTQEKPSKTYSTFLRSDPSSAMIGWQQCAGIVMGGAELATKSSGAPWFIIARDWRLAVAIDFYLPTSAPLVQLSEAHPRINAVQSPQRDNPLALWPRYDTTEGNLAGHTLMHALYITDDEKAMRPPAAIRGSFERCELLSSALIMHGGWQVRSLKVFACYHYVPPAL
jgi:Dolichyl-phosphate-mannose-protein mannosyltransferase